MTTSNVSSGSPPGGIWNSWEDMDPREYGWRNYGQKNILDEDRQLMLAMTILLWPLLLKWGKLLKRVKVADIGCGPSIIPAMFMAAALPSGSELNLIEYAAPNLDFLRTLIGPGPYVVPFEDEEGKMRDLDVLHMWDKFEEHLVGFGGEPFSGVVEKVREMAQATQGSLYELPKDAFDCATSFFVAESITDSPARCRQGIKNVIESVTPGGTFAIAFMLGSEGWHAGRGTKFPSTKLSAPELRYMLSNICEEVGNASGKLCLTGDAQQKARPGYDGMAVFIGQRIDGDVYGSRARLVDVEQIAHLAMAA